ncbi:Dihydroorotate dehydrogenase (quinone), mitochondrial [Lobaria immixta]|nr:Dihydroorotate dehydrogenase (quinone), mitochondrial [Lobaria immixta]
MSREAPPDAKSLVTRLKNVLLGTSIGLLFAFGYYYVTDTGASIHQWLVVPSLRRIYDDAEESHEAGTKALKALYGVGLHPRERGNLDSAGNLEVENALINRYCINSDGADVITLRLRQRVRKYAHVTGFGIDEVLDGEAGVPPGSSIEGKLLAVQIAKNTTTPDDDTEAIKADYVYCVDAFSRYADIIAVNILCPNNGSKQNVEPLRNILTSVVEETKGSNRKTKPVVMVKQFCEEKTRLAVSRTEFVEQGDRCDGSTRRLLRSAGIETMLALMEKYRGTLDDGMQTQLNPVSAPTEELKSLKKGVRNQTADQIKATVQRDGRQSNTLPQSSLSTSSFHPALSQILQTEAPKRKIIFASGRIANERQV